MSQPPQLSHEGTGWRLFEIRYRNLQAISKAQKVHLTALLILMMLLWTWYLSGSKDATLQGVALTADAIWEVAPAVLTFFALAFIGSINAALPAKNKLLEIARALGMETVACCQLAFYDLDTDKNVLDYLTFLKLSVRKNNFEQEKRLDVRVFLYPAVLLCVFITTIFFTVKLGFEPAVFVGVVCLVLQFLFARRLFFRAVQRFRGIDVDS